MTHREWEALLDRFEADLDSPEPHGDAWVPPTEPLPEELAPRARDIVARQHAAMQRLRAGLDEIQQQRGALGRVPREQSRPAYLDISG